MSVILIVTEVVAVLPEANPLMSWALTTTTYSSLVSRSKVFILQLITPAEGQRKSETFGEGVIFQVNSDSYYSKNSLKPSSDPKLICQDEKRPLKQGKHGGYHWSQPTCDAVDFKGWNVSMGQRVPEFCISSGGVICISSFHLNHYSS